MRIRQPLSLLAGVILVSSFIFSTTLFAEELKPVNPKESYNKGVKDVGGTGTSADLPITIKNIINLLLFLIGVAAVIIIVISGFRFVLAEGDSNGTNQARNSIIYASIGLIVAVSAYAIINFVLEQLV